MSEWISVEDELPEINDYYLVAGEDIDSEICRFLIGLGWQDDFDITHWMPLPEPPK